MPTSLLLVVGFVTAFLKLHHEFGAGVLFAAAIGLLWRSAAIRAPGSLCDQCRVRPIWGHRTRPMFALAHSRPMQLILPTGSCPLRSNSDRIVARQRNDAMGQEPTSQCPLRANPETGDAASAWLIPTGWQPRPIALRSDHRHQQVGFMLAAAMYNVPPPIGAGFVAEIDRHFVFRIAVYIGTLNSQAQRFA